MNGDNEENKEEEKVGPQEGGLLDDVQSWLSEKAQWSPLSPPGLKNFDEIFHALEPQLEADDPELWAWVKTNYLSPNPPIELLVSLREYGDRLAAAYQQLGSELQRLYEESGEGSDGLDGGEE